MIRARKWFGVVMAAALVAGAGAARADDSHGADVSAAAKGDVKVNAREDLAALKEKIQTQGAKVSEEAKSKSQQAMDEVGGEVDHHAQADGDAKMASRLGDEFGMSADAVLAEKSALGTSWGQLTIAHSIAANSNEDVTVEQLMEMRKDGMGWGEIAAGLDLELGSVVSSVKAESAVARGLAHADGKAMAMKGPGAKLDAGAGMGAAVGKGRAAVAPGAAVKVKVKN